jgi:hypothetical protein
MAADERAGSMPAREELRTHSGASGRPSGSGSSYAVELHIEELVLHGFAPGDHYHIGEAVGRELQRLLSEEGVPASLTSLDRVVRLDGGAFRLSPDSTPQAHGYQIARAIYGGLKQ